ncbi:hypothetical protein FHX74_002244 [Friedmanniella endophytica]|uniref:Uncharacterized protein n=1 Tax=Microlunatus kandeliicorticis TaxID=1759536 RepID=A0A7W3P673_9ACTN|nr:hypothetical protein [Microlunatus kandeliicorticis]MBA8794625.1 hypothetical protein [Microlunatus kandeliicorticis]
MPRLTNQRYLQDRLLVIDAWLAKPNFFSCLSSKDQRSLHDFYRPSHDLSDQEAIVHRQVVSRVHPSLPQRAGRALQSLHQAKAEQRPANSAQPLATSGRRRVPSSTFRITVHPRLRPDPDPRQLLPAMRALLDQEQRRLDDERAAAGMD